MTRHGLILKKASGWKPIAAIGATGAAAVNSALGLGTSTVALLKELAKLGLTGLIGVPTAAGLTAGYIGSKITSPTDSDMRLLEAKMVNAKVRAMRDQHRRRLEAEAAALKDDRANA